MEPSGAHVPAVAHCPPAVRWAALAGRHPGLRLLVLIGSRAAGTAHAGSDWDLGLLAEDGLDPLAVQADASRLLATDAVDVVDLAAASAVLRRDAAVVGRVLAEPEPGSFAGFQLAAVSFWADVEPVIREAHADVLRAAAA